MNFRFVCVFSLRNRCFSCFFWGKGESQYNLISTNLPGPGTLLRIESRMFVGDLFLEESCWTYPFFCRGVLSYFQHQGLVKNCMEDVWWVFHQELVKNNSPLTALINFVLLCTVIHPRKINMSSNKWPFQKERLVFQPLFFRGHVSFRGSRCFLIFAFQDEGMKDF